MRIINVSRIENIKMNIASVKTFKFQKLTIIRNILSTINCIRESEE